MTIMHRDAARRWWKIDVPREVVHYWHDSGSYFPECPPKWNVRTWQDVHAERTAKQNSRVSHKIREGTRSIKPAFIWVFHNNTNFFAGWYLYIKTLKDDKAINFRETNYAVMEKAMSLFPCGYIPLKQNFKSWMRAFAKQFPHVGFRRKKNQGLKKCHAVFDDHGYLIDLLPASDLS